VLREIGRRGPLLASHGQIQLMLPEEPLRANSEHAPLPSRGLILYHSVTSALVSLVKVSAKITGIENNSSAKRDTRFRRKQRPLTARRVRMPMPALRVTTTFCRPVERANACRNRFNRNTRSSDSTRTLARLQDTERTMPRAN
jgi:hypothetical protein